MKLDEWMQLKGLSVADFAMQAGISRQGAYSWMSGEISSRAMARVQALTDGAVLPLDFFPEQGRLVKDAHSEKES